MNLFNEIVKLAGEGKFADNNIPLNKLAFDKGFNILQTAENDTPHDYYEVFKAEKSDGDYKVDITITTKDKYKSFGNDEEPYKNTMKLYEGNNVIDSFEYTYFK